LSIENLSGTIFLAGYIQQMSQNAGISGSSGVFICSYVVTNKNIGFPLGTSRSPSKLMYDKKVFVKYHIAFSYGET